MSFGQDIAHLPGGAMLLISFILLYQRRVAAVVNAFAVQGAMLALAAAWQGWAQGAPQLYLVALIAAGAKAVLIPLALRALVRKLDLHRGVETALGIGPSLVAGIALVVLAVLVVLPVSAGYHAVAREDLALALSVLLLSLLMMITRRNAILQVIGLMSLENGLILAAVSTAGVPLVVGLSVAGLVLMGLILAGIFAFRIRERFDSVDAAFLETHGGEGG